MWWKLDKQKFDQIEIPNHDVCMWLHAYNM